MLVVCDIHEILKLPKLFESCHITNNGEWDFIGLAFETTQILFILYGKYKEIPALLSMTTQEN